MLSKKIIIPLFLLVSAGQLYVPASMIWEREAIIEEGTVFRFQTAPVDPNDLFRGKYIALNFERESVVVDSASTWLRDEQIYLLLEEDSLGLAAYKTALKSPPTKGMPYLKARANYTSHNDTILHFRLPFDRFYMEEHKAKPAEEVYLASSLSNKDLTYALVSVKNGEAVLRDVMINGKSLRELEAWNRDL